MKRFLEILSVIVAALTYGYITIVTAHGTGEGLSFTTFILWSILAGISCHSMIKTKGAWGIAMMYSIGAGSVAITLICKGRCQWSAFNTFIAVLAAICIYLSKTRGPTWGLITSVAAGLIASIPFVILTWQDPERSPFIASFGFFLGNTLSFLSGKRWNLEDRLYGGASAVACIFLVLPWLIWRFA